LVHGAAGHLGSLIIADLIAKGVAPNSIVAGVRDLNSAGSKKIAELGVRLCTADFTDKLGLEKAYSGIDTVVFIPIPGGTHLERAATAENSVNAAVKLGVKRFVLVSAPTGRSDSVNILAPGFLFSEALVRTSQLKSWVIVRMGIWMDIFLEGFKHAAQSGVLTQVAKPTDRILLISREDTARGIAAVIRDEKAIGKIFDLENNVAPSWTEITEYVSKFAGKKVGFKTITLAESTEMVASGLPEGMKSKAPFFAGIKASLAEMASKEVKMTNDYFELTGNHPESIRKYLKRNLQLTHSA